MRCMIHPSRESNGYCPNCGDFFCETCLIVCEDGRQYCERCMAKLGKRAKASEATKLSAKLLVKFKNGRQLMGTTYKIDPRTLGFSMVAHDARGAGEERYVEWADVKYVALVASLRGEPPEKTSEYQPKGSEVEVVFHDGEILKGFTLKRYTESESRFSVIPSDTRDNRISTIVERSAIERMSLGRTPKAQQLRVLADNSVRRLILHYYWHHPDAIMTLDQLAGKLGRAAAVVVRELEPFEHEGLVKRLETNQLRFMPAKDPVVRQAVSAMGKQLDMLYFKKPAAPPPAEAAPPKPTGKWPM